MKITLPEVALPAFNKLSPSPGANAYLSVGLLSVLLVLVWMLFSSFDIGSINGWLPYHAPVSIFLSSILLVLALRGWVKMLLGGEAALSLCQAAPEQSPEARLKRRSLGSLFLRAPRVLVVDDDPCVRQALCRKLCSLGVRATPACDGLEALLAVADRHWDMVLMDGEMPYMDGIEATREIRIQNLLSVRTPIIGITNNQEWDYRQKCLSAGMSVCRPKPRHVEDLEALLAEFLGSEIAGENQSIQANLQSIG